MTAFWMNILWSMSSQLYWEKETGQPAALHHCPRADDGHPAGHGAGRAGRHHPARRCHHPAGQPALPGAVRGGLSCPCCCWSFSVAMVALYGMGMMTASLFLLLSREAWHIANLAQEPIYPRLRLLLPDQELPLLGGGCRLDHPADPGPGRHAPAGFCHRAHAGLSQHGHRTADPAGAGVIFLLAARFLLDYMEKLAIREGRLTESRR